IETAVGVLNAAQIAAAPGVRGLAFGNVDLGLDLNVDPADAAATIPIRSHLVVVSRAARIDPPSDVAWVRFDVPDGLRRAATPAQQLASWVAGLGCDDLPKEVVESVGDRVMDVLGIGVAASDADATLAARTLAIAQGGIEEAGLVAHPARLPAASAALVNGTA